jgi:hypothetical protein
MLCWVCERQIARRGVVCQACRREARKDSAPRLHIGLGQSAGLLVGLLSVAAGLLIPAVVSLPTPSWRHPATLVSHLPHLTPAVFRTTMVEGQVKRKVYPYSIVPGGAETLHEARWAMDDPAIKSHYANVNVAQLKQIKLTTNLTGYVSYRWGEKIYWTAKKITLHAGETVFTDGTHIVRGRCLNCYSALPMAPIRPHEPTEALLDLPVEMPVTVYTFPMLPVSPLVLPIPPGELTPTVPVIPSSVTPPAGSKPGGIWFPLIPIIPPIHRHPGNGPSSPTSPGTPQVPPPVAIVPEPHYSWLLALGFLAIVVVIRRRRLRFSPERLRD